MLKRATSVTSDILNWTYHAIIFETVLLLTPIHLIHHFIDQKEPHSDRTKWILHFSIPIGGLLLAYLLLWYLRARRKAPLYGLRLLALVPPIVIGDIVLRTCLSSYYLSGDQAFHNGWVAAFRLLLAVQMFSRIEFKFFWFLLVDLLVGWLCLKNGAPQTLYPDVFEVIVIQALMLALSKKKGSPETLAQENESLKGIVEDLKQAMVIVDFSSSSIVYSNKKFNKIYDDLRVQNCLEFLGSFDCRIDPHGPVSSCEISNRFHEAIRLADKSDIGLMNLKEYFTKIKEDRKALEEFYGADGFVQSPLITLGCVFNGSTQPGDNIYCLEATIYIRKVKDAFSLVFVLADTSEREELHSAHLTSENNTRLLAAVCHEIRSALGSSTTLIELSLDSPEIPEKVKSQGLVPAFHSSNLLLSFIDSFIDFSKVQVNKLQLNNTHRSIIKTLKECIEVFKFQAEKKGISIIPNIKIPDDKPEFVTDHHRVAQVVTCLLTNALKSTVRGTITVRANFAAVGSRNSRQKNLQISVEDTGVGMSLEEQRKLLQELNKETISLDPSYSGLGLILANSLAKQLSRANDRLPAIKFESQQNKGSKFWFLMPEQSAPPTHYMISMDSSEFSSGIKILRRKTSHELIEKESLLDINHILPGVRTKTFFEKTNLMKCYCPQILVVDDDVFTITAFENIVESMGYTCDEAYNGQMAMQKIDERCQKKCGGDCLPYSIVFMACNLPGVTGLEASRALKERMRSGKIPEINIIAFAAGDAEAMRKSIESCGMSDICPKPLKKQIIENLLERYI